MIRIDYGLNRIVRFSPDGRPAIIVMGWRDTGHGQGYHQRTVLLPRTKGKTDWGVVGVDYHGQGFQDSFHGDPHQETSSIRSLAFAHGVLDGRYETLLLVATRDIGLLSSGSDATRVNYEVYKLVHKTDESAKTSDYFDFVMSEKSDARFCNAAKALAAHFRVALSPYYSGPKTADGCAPPGG